MGEIPYKIYLEESEMPAQWYNVRADMKKKPGMRKRMNRYRAVPSQIGFPRQARIGFPPAVFQNIPRLKIQSFTEFVKSICCNINITDI